MCRETSCQECWRDSPPVQVSKTVRFNEAENKELVVMNRQEWTRAERFTCFFSEEEYIAIRQCEKTLARHLALVGSVASLGEDDLGLETRSAKTTRRQRMKECILSVLLEQELQNETDQGCGDDLAEVMFEYSSYSTQLACNRAYDNAIQVQKNCVPNSIPANDESKDIIDCPISPTSTIEPFTYDNHATCASCPLNEQAQKRQGNDQEVWPEKEDERVSMQEDEVDQRKIEFQPPFSWMKMRVPPPPPPAPARVTQHPPPIMDPTARAIHYYYPMRPHPWEERWSHPYSQEQNASGPLSHSRWYIAE